MTRNAAIGLMIITMVVVGVLAIMYFNVTRRPIEIKSSEYSAEFLISPAA